MNSEKMNKIITLLKSCDKALGTDYADWLTRYIDSLKREKSFNDSRMIDDGK